MGRLNLNLTLIGAIGSVIVLGVYLIIFIVLPIASISFVYKAIPSEVFTPFINDIGEDLGALLLLPLLGLAIYLYWRLNKLLDRKK